MLPLLQDPQRAALLKVLEFHGAGLSQELWEVVSENFVNLHQIRPVGSHFEQSFESVCALFEKNRLTLNDFDIQIRDRRALWEFARSHCYMFKGLATDHPSTVSDSSCDYDFDSDSDSDEASTCCCMPRLRHSC